MVRNAGLGESVRVALVSALAHQLAEDHFAKLEQAGVNDDDAIPLRRVFIDLYTTEREDGASSPKKKGIVAELLSMAPAAMSDGFIEDQIEPQGKHRKACAGFIIIGGPGQGKSTLGQLACQAHRVALLVAHRGVLAAKEQKALADFVDAKAAKEIPLPQAPSFPVRIVLPDAATWLNEQEQKGNKSTPLERSSPMLLRFWWSSLPETAQKVFAPADVLALLKAAPSFVVLDGLDEVPAAGARERLIAAVRELGAALRGAKSLWLATTRPQGYAGELDGLGLALHTRYLAPLDAEQALTYAKRLVEARLHSQSEQAKVMARMKEAAEEAATRRLMTTPLQVTILAALLRTGGRPPRERWNLFSRYYDVMYDREKNKPTEVALLLDRYKQHIETIHARAGLLLHVESESADWTNALLTRERLEDIAHAVLSAEGFNQERQALVEQMVRAAEQRLVFMVQPRENRFGFEIRSLQEFMAAKALAQKGESATKARLTHIARASSFRNVTLFLTGKLYASSEDIRGAIGSEVCPALQQDPRDPVAKEAFAGAALALDILEDGAVLNQPKYAADLMRAALGIVDVAPNDLHARLARFYLSLDEHVPARAEIEPLLRDGLQTRLAGESTKARVSAWMTLLSLVEGGEKRPVWAAPMAEASWPADSAERTAIVRAAQSSRRRQAGQTRFLWLLQRVEESLGDYAWLDVYQYLSPWRSLVPKGSIVRRLLQYLRSDRLVVKVLYPGGMFAGLGPRSTESSESWQDLLERLPDSTPSWRALRALLTFSLQPRASSLADAIRALANLPADEVRQLSDWAPWPLSGALLSAFGDNLIAPADHAEAGDYGDLQDWRQAEGAWSNGVTLKELVSTLVAPQHARGADAPRLLAYALLDALFARRYIDDDSSIVMNALFSEAEPGVLAKLIAEVRICTSSVLQGIVDSNKIEPTTLDQWGRRYPRLLGSRGVEAVPPIAEMYIHDPSLQGLVHWLAQMTEPPPIQRELLDRERFQDPVLRADAWIVRLTQGLVHVNDVALLLQDAASAKDLYPLVFSELIGAAFSKALDVTVRDTLLVTLHASTNDVEAATTAASAMYSVLQSRTSGLSDPAVWDKLELPLPRPAADTPPPRPGAALFGPPVHLKRLVLHNVRSFGHVDLPFTIPSPDQGQWVVILGENGTGKTTLLRSIVLALRNLSDPKIWPKGTFSPAWMRYGINPETDSCRIALHVPGSQEPFETTIRKNGKEVFLQSPPRSASAPAPCFVWAYGCRRGSALGGFLQAVDTQEDDGPDVATLFDERASLVHAETWLQTLDGEASRDKTGRVRSIFNAVIEALKKILDVTEVDFDAESNIVVSGRNVGERVPLTGLSDGYLTTAGWLLDLLARWIAQAKQAGVPVEPSFPETMTGLVLLDEIDLHLHPAWQLDVIPRVRNIFKKLSFVVTTHNPLTIVGARPEEIWILRRDESGVVAEQKREIPATLTAAQIYGRFFGIEGFFPHAHGRALERYGFLCGNVYRSEEEQREMEGLREQLKQAGIEPGWRELPRVVAPARAPQKKLGKKRSKPS